MADQDTIICIGSSNMAGFLANLYDVPAADYLRWTSQLTPTPSTPTRPYVFQVPGVRCWTPRRPYSLNAQRDLVTVGGGSNTTVVEYGGAAIGAPSVSVDMWMFVREGTGRGNLRKITSVVGQTIFVAPVMSPTPAVDDTIVVLQDSHSLHSVSADLLTITKVAGTTPNFTAADIGRFVSFFDSAPGGDISRKVIAQTDDTLTFDQPLSAFPTVASAAGTARVVTFNGTAETVQLTAHGFVAGTPVVFTGGTPPVEVVPGTTYYVVNPTANDFQLAATLGGAFFPFTGNGSGTTVVQRIQVVAFNGLSEVVTLAAHGFAAAQPLVFEGGTPPPEILPRTVYYAIPLTADTFLLATTAQNALSAVNFAFTGDGTGTTTVRAVQNGFCVLSGANAVHDLATMQPPRAVLQDLTFTLDEVTPVYLTGLDYTNWDFTAWTSPRALSFDPTINSVAELSFHVKSKTAQPLVVLQLGVSASMISTFPLDTNTARTLVGPLHDITSLDFSPASPQGIYEILTSAIDSTRALIEAEGNTMKVRGIFINLFDNDPTADIQRTQRLGANTRLLRNALYAYLGEEVPWIMSGPSAYAGGPGAPSNERVYAQLFAIAAEHPLCGVVDTRKGFTYAEDNAHLSALSQIKLGQEFFRVWEPIHESLVGPTSASDLAKVALCNRALAAVGDVPNLTSLDPPEGSVHASSCALLCEQAVKLVATARHWTFADRRVALAKIELVGPLADVASNLISTGMPHGLKNGSPVSFVLIGTSLPAPLQQNTTYYAVEVTPMAFGVASTPGGAAINLTTAGSGEWEVRKESDRTGYRCMYALPAGCAVERAVLPPGAPDDALATVGGSLGRSELGSGFVTASVGGLNFAVDASYFGERNPIPFKRATNLAGEQVIYTDLSPAELLFTGRLDDATLWPPEFEQAVEAMLTSYLFGSVKKDPKQALEYLQIARFHVSEASRIDSQRAPVVQPNRFPLAR